MGMFDSFYFAEGVLPDNKEGEGFEFQTKDLDLCLDIYLIDADRNVTIRSYEDFEADVRSIRAAPDLKATVYSLKFIYDIEPGEDFGEYLKKRELVKTCTQLYEIEIKDGKLISAKKIHEEGYE